MVSDDDEIESNALKGKTQSGGGSKGGHAAKEEGEGGYEKAIFKVLVKFEGDLLEFNDIKRVERQFKHSTTSATGQDYILLIRFNSYPFNKEYVYYDEKVRDRMFLRLESKLQEGRTMIL